VYSSLPLDVLLPGSLLASNPPHQTQRGCVLFFLQDSRQFGEEERQLLRLNESRILLSISGSGVRLFVE